MSFNKIIALTFLTALLMLSSCKGLWDTVATWKKIAVVSIEGNEFIYKTANTQERESKSGIASIKDDVHSIGGEKTQHSYRPVFEKAVAYTHNRLENFEALSLLTSNEVVSSEHYSALQSDADYVSSQAKTNAGKAFLKVAVAVTADPKEKTITSDGYKSLSDIQAQLLREKFGLDAVLTFDIDFKYDLVGFKTSGSAKGVAVLHVTLHYVDVNSEAITTTLSYTGISDGKCDVKTGGFFKGEEMEPLLTQAYENALTLFLNTAQTELAEIRAAEAAAASAE